MNFSITPNQALWLNAAYVVLTGLTAGSLTAAGVSAGDAAHVVGIAALIAMPLNIVLHMVSAPVAGPAVAK